MEETELYKELKRIMQDKINWEYNINQLFEILKSDYSTKIKAKTLWIIGEIGLKNYKLVENNLDLIHIYLFEKESILRARAINALGRIGRANSHLIKKYVDDMISLSRDEAWEVRMNFIWAAENIATNDASIYKNHIEIFSDLLDDDNLRVRIEAPEIFRVIGKSNPQYVFSYLRKLKFMSENDDDKVVRIHANGAVRAIEKATIL